MAELVVDAKRICKAFPGVRALDGVDFAIRAGEVVGLLGENGAGKSTLVKILAGVHRADAGELWFGGRRVEFATIQQAQAAGVTLIFQELNNCPNLTPLDNLFLGRELRRRGSPLLDYPAMRARARALFERLGVEVDLDVDLHTLSTAVQQMIEIAKALLGDVRLLIMDEPTSSLTEAETARLFTVIRELRDRGTAIVFISHKLGEVFEITERIVVLRDGKNAGEIDARTGTREQLIAAMVGRELAEADHRARAAPGPEILRVDGLSGPPHIEDVSFALRQGEILGVAGLLGAGRTETARLVIGAERATRGRVLIDGREVRIRSPRDAARHGIAYVPEDRKVQALILAMSVRENLTLAIHHVLRWLRWFLSRRKEAAVVDRHVAALRIKIASREQAVNQLSGGNQQKVVLARCLALAPRILILDEPTRGIDVAAKAEVHRTIAELAARGVAILLISSELPEILALSDRVMVMDGGRVQRVLDHVDATQEAIMTAALSGSPDAVAPA
ncbi:MAG TPA: sugar ABC transporter ATP-binding protein [Kofleriaceae bacterium]|jgi:ABC-type sugar transport system ATPase subunit|nr:sugar ABC transporter ATP-binding protein [Kofleriaceae bacterium]